MIEVYQSKIQQVYCAETQPFSKPKKKVLRKWRPNLESEIRCEDRPARRKPTPVLVPNGIPWVLLNFPASCVKPKKRLESKYGVIMPWYERNKKYTIFFYKKSRQHKQTAHLSTLFEKNMLPRCGCAITGTISSLKLPGPLVIESGELKTHPSWLDPYVNTGYIHRLDHRCTSYTMLEVKLISGGGDNLWIQACTPNKA